MIESQEITGNVGEWSELYALLKILSDGHLQQGDDYLNALPIAPSPLISASRGVERSATFYKLAQDKVHVSSFNEETSLSREDCLNWAAELLIELKKKSQTSGARAIPAAKKWMLALRTTQLKAKSKSKADIELVLHDLQVGISRQLGYSIKSRIGGASTLLNPTTDKTNIEFDIEKIETISEDEIRDFNLMKKFEDKFNCLPPNFELTYRGFTSSVFKDNLLMADGLLPEILAELIKHFYLQKNKAKPITKISDLCKIIENINPLNINLSIYSTFYSHKIKRLLMDIALGFTPATPWLGSYQASGGYIIVKETGDLLSYHLYNKDQFEQYLFLNTRFETPSKKKHSHGSIIKKENLFQISLAVQIRFVD
jgi:hypothetical protein